MAVNLLANSVWQTVFSVLLAVLLLLVMITVHEFGHYLAGKLLKFKINEFSIGFGPKILQRTNRKNGEKFTLRAIPLGGYCAFEDENGLDGELPPAEQIFGDESPEKSGRFCDQAPWKRIVVLLAGATMNYLLALLVIVISFFAFGQLSFVAYSVAPTEAYAQENCLQDKDVLLEANGRRIYMTGDLMNAVANKKEGDTVSFLVSRLGENGRSEQNVEIALRHSTDFVNSADTDRLWLALGIAPRTNEAGQVVADGEGNVVYEIYTTNYRYSFFRTLGGGFVYSFRIAGSIFKVLGELLTGALGLNTLGGPITTIAITSQVASRGVQPFLEIAAYIGVNLAVFNLLPIPALDGSKVLFTLIEWIRKKPIDRKIEAVVHTVGFLLLFGFAILVDVLKLF